MSGRIVIVGASLGGLRTAERLRARGFTGEIVAIGDERHPPYNRPPLSKEALAREVTHEAVAFRMRPSVADVTWRLGVGAVAADLAARTLRLADDTELACDGLVVATGVRPRRLPGPLAGRHVVRTLDDAAALRAALRPGADVLVIGAGFIGCEIAATARTLGARVTVVAPEPAPMLRPLGPLLANALRDHHERHGVHFLLGRTIHRFLTSTPRERGKGTHPVPADGVGSRPGLVGGQGAPSVPVGGQGARSTSVGVGSSRLGGGGGRVVGVELSDGAVVTADVVVEAVGSVPNVEWLAGNGLDLSDGVLCGNDMRVCPGVVAVGDVARFPNPRYDEVPRRVEHWSVPVDTARRAAATLLADLGLAAPDTASFRPLPGFWSDQYGLRVQSFGMPALGTGDVRVLEGDPAGEVVAGYHRDGELVGVVMIGCASAVPRYRDLLLRTPEPVS